MYEDNNGSFALKSLIVKILIAILLIFIVIWLFPTKGYIDKAIEQKLGTNAEQIFNTNIGVMKNAAMGYFNGSRLPQKEGNTKKINLEEMLAEDLLVEFTDSKGKKCDLSKSYVEVKKNKDDYKMTTNLVCTDKTAKVISYFGNYDYCTNGVCEKKKLTENNASDDSNTVNTEEKQAGQLLK